MSKLKLCFFSDASGAEAFDRSLVSVFSELQRLVVAQYLSANNTQHFRHGGDLSHPGDPEIFDTGMQKHKAVLTAKFEDIVENRLETLTQILNQYTTTVTTQFTKMLYSTVEASCDRTGNVVDANAEGSLLDAYAAVLEKIEFIADKEGNVKMPEFHLGSDIFKRMQTELDAASPEYQARIDSIKAKKISEAKDKEIARKARFISYGERL